METLDFRTSQIVPGTFLGTVPDTPGNFCMVISSDAF